MNALTPHPSDVVDQATQAENDLRRAPYDGPFADYVLVDGAPGATVYVAGAPYMLRPDVRLRLPAEDPKVAELVELGAIRPAPPRPEPIMDPRSQAYLDHDDVAPLAEKARALGVRADEAEARAKAEDDKATAAEDGLDDLRTAVILEEATEADVTRAEKLVEKHRGIARRARLDAAAIRRAQRQVEEQVTDARTVVRHSEARAIEDEAADLYADAAEVAQTVSALVARAQRFRDRTRLLPNLVRPDDPSVTAPTPTAPAVQFAEDHLISSSLRSWLVGFRERAERAGLDAPLGLPAPHQWPADVEAESVADAGTTTA